MIRVLGLDLSLTGTGLCVIPADWGCNWDKCITAKLGATLDHGASLSDELVRLDEIRSGVLRFCADHYVTHVWVEQYAFSARQSRSHALGEVGGVVKLALHRRSMPLQTVVVSQARSILGKVPRKDSKVHTRALLTAMGAPVAWDGDEADAFVVANWGLSELDEACIIGPGAS